jgi:hypothetical protein
VALKGDDPFAPARLARCGGKYSMLLHQFRAEEPSRGDLAELGLRAAQDRYGEQRDLPEAFWVWSRPYWFLFRDGPGRPAVSRRYGADQATGGPDTMPSLEAPSAWCPATKAGGPEWLELDFGGAVRTTRIDVRQSHGPSTIVRVIAYDERGRAIEVWHDAEPMPCPPFFHFVDVPGFLVTRVRIEINTKPAGWTEIDAVGLVDDRGDTHWAVAAAASSTYADVEAAVAKGR